MLTHAGRNKPEKRLNTRLFVVLFTRHCKSGNRVNNPIRRARAHYDMDEE